MRKISSQIVILCWENQEKKKKKEEAQHENQPTNQPTRP